MTYLCHDIYDPAKATYAVNQNTYQRCGEQCSCMAIETLCFTEVIFNDQTKFVFSKATTDYALQCNICKCNFETSP